MMNRKLMLSVIAAAAAAGIGLGSIYAAATDIVPEGPDTGVEETEETETETETETGTEQTQTADPEEESFLVSLLDSLTGNRTAESVTEKNAYPEAYEYEGDEMVMSAAETGLGYYAEPAMPAWNTEEYSTVDETGFRDVKLYPLSTFGMDVDTASYSLLRRNTLDDTLGWMPKDAVRIEEMINYFNYEYEMPEEGETFTITAQIADCPWNDQTKLMLVGLQAKDIPAEEIKEQNLVFLVDTSGSMYDADKLPLAVDALKYLMKELDEKDSVSIVTYAGSSEIALEPTRCTGEGKQEIIAALDALSADGGTYGEAGIRTAYELAQRSFIEGGNNRVLLLTDGDFNLGQTDDSELVSLVKEKADGQIFLSILGFGTGNYNDALAEELADKGNGNYSYIDSDMEARRVMGAALKGTLNTVAKDSKVQVDFNPVLIKGYRLVGYENRMMNAEDFEDDTKDGGEVGAGQQVTVLYELVPADSDMEIPTAHSRYSDDAATAGGEEAGTPGSASETADEAGTSGDPAKAADEADPSGDELQPAAPGQDEYLTVSIRYKDPEAEKSQLKERAVTAADEIDGMSDSMSWAAGVAQVGMLLRESEYAGTSSYDEVHDRLQALAAGDEFREEFVYLITRFKGVKLEDGSPYEEIYADW